MQKQNFEMKIGSLSKILRTPKYWKNQLLSDRLSAELAADKNIILFFGYLEHAEIFRKNEDI